MFESWLQKSGPPTWYEFSILKMEYEDVEGLRNHATRVSDVGLWWDLPFITNGEITTTESGANDVVALAEKIFTKSPQQHETCHCNWGIWSLPYNDFDTLWEWFEHWRGPCFFSSCRFLLGRLCGLMDDHMRSWSFLRVWCKNFWWAMKLHASLMKCRIGVAAPEWSLHSSLLWEHYYLHLIVASTCLAPIMRLLTTVSELWHMLQQSWMLACVSSKAPEGYLRSIGSILNIFLFQNCNSLCKVQLELYITMKTSWP